MADSTNNLLSLRDLVRVAFKHKQKAIATAAVVIAIAIGCAMTWPESYVSEAKLLVRIGRDSVGLDPTASIGKTISATESRERQLSSALEILGSRELFEEVITKIGIAEILATTPDFADMSYALQDTKSSEDNPAAWDAAVRKIEKSLAREVARNSSVIVLTCRERSPQLAQSILGAYVDAFMLHHMKLHRTSGSLEFFESQAAQLQDQLQTASNELRDAKNAIGVTSIESEVKMLQQRMATLEQSIIVAQTSLAESRAKYKRLQQKYPDSDAAALILAGTSGDQAAVNEMRKDLNKLKLQEGELLGKYAAHHPAVAAFQGRIAKAQRVLDQQELVAELSNAQSMDAKIQELEQQYDEAKTAVLKLNQDGIKIKTLEQRVATVSANLEKYRDSQEQARIDSDLESNHISNVNIAQAPTYSPKHAGPTKSMFGLLGIVAALFAGFVVTMAAEYFDDTFHMPEQIEQTLQLPVVLSIPSAPSEVAMSR